MKPTLVLLVALSAAMFIPVPAFAADTPADLAAVRAKPNQHGPFRTDPAQGIPKHAYSPFDKINAPPERPLLPGRDFLPGRVAIKLKPPTASRTKSVNGLPDVAALQEKFASYGLTGVERVFRNAESPASKPAKAAAAVIADPANPEKPDLTRWLKASCSTNLDVRELVKQLAEDPDVEMAEPDYAWRLAGYIPNGDADALFASQWHLPAAKVPETWAYLDSQGLPPGGNHDIVVAVIDTGVDYNHPDLAANMWVNSREIAGNGIDDDGNGFVDDVHGCRVIYNTWEHNGDPQDDHGHGTHVAGIIGAQAGNSSGLVGVAYNCQIMAIKAAQYSGVLSTTDIAEGINYAVANGADVINMSFGGYGKSQVVEDALAVAFGQCALVAAAGNDAKVNLPCPFGADMYPAAYNWVLGVMASAPGGAKASFSNYDCTPHDTHEYELLAPGVDIWSTLPNGQYAAWDGTSMATPVVAGIAALARTKWSDKDVYSSRFIMGQIAANASPVANALASLTNAPQPELRYLEHWTFDTASQAAGNDNDGRVDAGETIDLAVVIRNHWGKASNVVVMLDAWAVGAVGPDPYVTWLTNTVDYGAVGAFNWDDNGLIYSNQVIVGVQHPFRFYVTNTCPNDHVIPFRVTMSCRNGFDPADTTDYRATNRFNLVVQRGRELPRIISTNMTLTKEDFWIVPAQTLIESGVTVTINPGTQVQWGSPRPADPYSEPTTPMLMVRGDLNIVGTQSEPIELFPSELLGGYVWMDTAKVITYAKVRNPQLGLASPPSYEPSDTYIIDHCFFDADSYSADVGFAALHISHSIFKKCTIRRNAPGNVNLWDCVRYAPPWWNSIGGQTYYNFGPSTTNCVFLADSTRAYHFCVHRYSYDDYSSLVYNAFLNRCWDPNINHWIRFGIEPYRQQDATIASNYWGTTSPLLINAAIYDYNDNFNLRRITYQPVLEAPLETMYPFVSSVELSTASQTNVSVVGSELVTFTVVFNRNMDTNVQPQVSFGPDTPLTDYTVHPLSGGWQDARTWVGTFNINPITGDGYQLIRVAGAVAADDPWLVTGDDAGRFRFEIITSGAESMNLQATGGEGRVDLSWMQDDFDLLSGYNLYRSTNPSNDFSRLNGVIIPAHVTNWTDTAVAPGQPYYYKFNVVTGLGESTNFSNVAEGRPLDTIPPVLGHTPITSHPAGQNLTIPATATDNVGVQALTLYFRTTGTSTYTSRAMTHISGSQYAATIEGSRVVSPGLEYYIEATDGISIIRSGLASNPWQVTVSDRPVVTVVTPNHGPASGGTFMTVSGSNFKTGAKVSIGSVPATGVTVVNANQITCTTGSHFPAAADVVVTNPDAQTGTLLRGFTYESDVASVSLPNTGGAHGSIVQVPLNAANVQGLRSADLTVTFDPAVLEYRTVRTSSLTPGWSVLGNSPSSGQVRVALAHTSSSSGAGTLASLEFEVIGVAGASCALGLPTLLLNDGAILVQIAAGSFAVNPVYDVTGAVSFWNGGAGVPGVLCTLQGDQVFTATSGGGGAFTVAGAAAGNYTLAPSKSDNVNGITSYDASLVLQHAVGLITLSGHAATAADVNKSGAITSFDAAYILEKSVDLIPVPFPGAGVVWDFSPTSRTITSLSGNLPGQDFTAILLGDVSGNWSPSAGAPPSPRGGGSNGPKDPPPAVTLALRTVNTRSNGTEFWLLARAQESPIYSLDLVLSNRLSQGLAGLRSGAFAETMAVTSNTNNRNLVRVGLAGAVPLRGVGALLVLTLPNGGSNDVALISALIQEGTVPVQIDPSGDSFDADTDGDGQTDWAEIRAGTVATDRRSVFALHAVIMERGGTRKISWSAVPGKFYQVWFMPEGVGGDWQLLGAPVQAASEEANVLDDASMFGSGRMYRVQLVE